MVVQAGARGQVRCSKFLPFAAKSQQAHIAIKMCSALDFPLNDLIRSGKLTEGENQGGAENPGGRLPLHLIVDCPITRTSAIAIRILI